MRAAVSIASPLAVRPDWTIRCFRAVFLLLAPFGHAWWHHDRGAAPVFPSDLAKRRRCDNPQLEFFHQEARKARFGWETVAKFPKSIRA